MHPSNTDTAPRRTTGFRTRTTRPETGGPRTREGVPRVRWARAHTKAATPKTAGGPLPKSILKKGPTGLAKPVPEALKAVFWSRARGGVVARGQTGGRCRMYSPSELLGAPARLFLDFMAGLIEDDINTRGLGVARQRPEAAGRCQCQCQCSAARPDLEIESQPTPEPAREQMQSAPSAARAPEKAADVVAEAASAQ